eukprot:1161266-Pelagomonas_calceolata.AAC.1
MHVRREVFALSFNAFRVPAARPSHRVCKIQGHGVAYTAASRVFCLNSSAACCVHECCVQVPARFLDVYALQPHLPELCARICAACSSLQESQNDAGKLSLKILRAFTV